MSTGIPLGAFTLRQPIGKGGMGVIWLGEHRAGGLPVAVKVLTVKRAKDDLFQARFRREVEAVSTLSHPNIVHVFDLGEVSAEAEARSSGRLVSGSPYLVMEYVPGGSLAERRGRLPWPEQHRITLALLGALAHAHAHGVIHRDIKPGNVLIADDGSVKLTDFGLAHVTETGESTTDRGGTPAYMAPEQLQGRWRDYGPWTDLYALGCMAWAISSGQPPFNEPNWRDVMRSHLTRDPPPLRPRHSVPRGYEPWLRHLLEKDPAHRFRRAADAAWALLPMVAPPDQGVVVDATAPGTDSEPTGDPPSTSSKAARTTLFWEPEEIPEVSSPAAPAAVPAARFSRAPLPARWRGPDTGALPLEGAGLGLYGIRSVGMVGREEERDALWAGLHAVIEQGRARGLLLRGPAGAGKSRLAKWLCRRAHEVGAVNVLRAGATEGESGASLRRLVMRHLRCGALEPHATQHPGRGLLTTQGVVDEFEWMALTRLMHADADLDVPVAAPHERHALVARLVARLCRERPVVLLVDDGQECPDAVLMALHVLEANAELQVLVLVTAGEAAADETGPVAELAVHPAVSLLDVEHLAPVYVSALVRDLLGLEGELAERVEARCAGNPMFAVRLVGDWVDRGLLVPSVDGFRLKPGVRVELPDELHALWQDALAEVLAGRSEDDQRCVEVAAALGRRVDAREWRAAVSTGGWGDPDPVAEALEQARMFRRVEHGWRFVHSMLHESIERASRDAGRWASHHALCAAILEDRYPEGTGGVAGRLGRHRLEAGDTAAAADLLLRGARASYDVSRYQEALELLERRDRALKALGIGASDLRRFDGFILRAEVNLAQGRFGLAVAPAERATAIARASGDRRLRALATTRLGEVRLENGRPTDAEALYEEAQEAWRDLRDWGGLADCLHGRGRVAFHTGQFAAAQDLLEQARAAYAGANVPLRLASCVLGLGYVHIRLGQLERATKHITEGLARFEGLGNGGGEARARLLLASVHRIRGDAMTAATLIDQALALFEATGDPSGQLGCLNERGELARWRGDLEEAEEAYSRALAVGETMGAAETVVPATNLALILLARGATEIAASRFADLVQRGEQLGRRDVSMIADAGMLVCAVRNHDLEGAERLAQKLEVGSASDVVDPDVASLVAMAADGLDGPLAQRLRTFAARHVARSEP
ncbi:MAG: tetratricopeptide (TPR) repeat protein [Myxococcota bacterium]